MSGQMAHTTLVEALSARLSDPVDHAARERAGLHLLDWTGCALAGSISQVGQILLGRADGHETTRAFRWGGLGNVLEMDDVDKRAVLHPGPVVIPAVLSLAVEEGEGGTGILQAVVRGYEAVIRLGRCVGPGHYKLWHPTGTCGPLGAAAACASLLHLDQAKTAHALSLAVSQAAGFWQTRHEPASMGKQLHAAHAARCGLEAARLAALGFRGPLRILEGSQGFFAAMCPDADPHVLMEDGEVDWLIHQVSFKPWPACRHAHPAIDAALQARKAFDPADMDQVRVRTYQDALTFCDKPEPTTVIEAKFSLQHAVAVSLIKGPPELEDFEPAAIADPRLAGLRRRVSVGVGDAFQKAYPAHYGAELSIESRAGAQTFTVSDALGDPEQPMTKAQLEAKSARLMAWAGLDEARAARLIQTAPSASQSFLTDLCAGLA